MVWRRCGDAGPLLKVLLSDCRAAGFPGRTKESLQRQLSCGMLPDSRPPLQDPFYWPPRAAVFREEPDRKGAVHPANLCSRQTDPVDRSRPYRESTKESGNAQYDGEIDDPTRDSHSPPQSNRECPPDKSAQTFRDTRSPPTADEAS